MSTTYKLSPSVIKAIDPAAKTVRALVSTASIDRDGEIVLPSAFSASLPGYLKNPTFLWAHSWHGEPENVLGVCTSATVTAQGLECVFRYDVDINPKAAQVFAQVQAGTLKAFSVGFYPKASVTRYSTAAERAALPVSARQALEKGTCSKVFTEVELLEVSQVPIPSNRDALAAGNGGKALVAFRRAAQAGTSTLDLAQRFWRLPKAAQNALVRSARAGRESRPVQEALAALGGLRRMTQEYGAGPAVAALAALEQGASPRQVGRALLGRKDSSDREDWAARVQAASDTLDDLQSRVDDIEDEDEAERLQAALDELRETLDSLQFE